MGPWTCLALAGLFEVGFTTCLALERRHKDWVWGFITCAVVSFSLLERAIRTIPVGTAYAVWTGIGAVGTIVVGMFFFRERLRPAALLLVAMAVGLIAALKVTS